MSRVKPLALLVLAGGCIQAADPINWETGTVVSQDLMAQQAGTYAGPLGMGRIGLPIYRRFNIVVVETGPYRYSWQEEQTRHPVVLVVNDAVQFYRDGKWFVVLDAEKHKHKFGLMSASKISN